MAKHTALQAIFAEAGFSVSTARHLATTLDRLRLSSLGSDDIAAALFRWRSEAVERRWHGYAIQQTCKSGLIDLEALFGMIEEERRERQGDTV